jgi:hypothetical protein
VVISSDLQLESAYYPFTSEIKFKELFLVDLEKLYSVSLVLLDEKSPDLYFYKINVKISEFDFKNQ